jgi:hypothetical protein
MFPAAAELKHPNKLLHPIGGNVILFIFSQPVSLRYILSELCVRLSLPRSWFPHIGFSNHDFSCLPPTCYVQQMIDKFKFLDEGVIVWCSVWFLLTKKNRDESAKKGGTIWDMENCLKQKLSCFLLLLKACGYDGVADQRKTSIL